MSRWRRRDPAQPDPDPTERLDPRERSWQTNRPDDRDRDGGHDPDPDELTTELHAPGLEYLLSGGSQGVDPDAHPGAYQDGAPADSGAGWGDGQDAPEELGQRHDLFGNEVGAPAEHRDADGPGEAATTWLPADPPTDPPADPPTQAVPAAPWQADEPTRQHTGTWHEPESEPASPAAADPPADAPEPTREWPAGVGFAEEPVAEPVPDQDPEPVPPPVPQPVPWQVDERARAAQRASARAEILGRVRAAVGGRPGPEEDVPRGYRRTSGLGRDEAVALFAERVADYKATVRPIMREQLAATIAVCLVERGIRRIAVPLDLPRSWLPQYVDVRIDHGDLTGEDLDEIDGVITGCALGIAETGTIVLDGGRLQGRRLLSLVPDYHLCVVDTLDVVGNLPDALAKLDPSRPLTFISGPSATSDIELNRVEGVHGPRTLDVLLTG